MRRRAELRELAFAVNAGMAGGKAIDKNFPDPSRGVPSELWDGDPDDRPLTPSEKPVYEADELDDWERDIKGSWQPPA